MSNIKTTLKGFGNKSVFVDIDGNEYNNYCPACKSSIRAPSNAWPNSLWNHSNTKKHIRNNGASI